ncbi:hypothetical protein BO70DRAFT_302200 [Aspergillus heteromorphus CBS 117.55]|uniref:FHA domain protein n=1 Tax=Aspergillus heteromorphus CBS 117.55 TaxID=1448321 RepID=A0A317V052_9EURO|nr:uncharacterized protein BO70DRAFT_302200 [Aspergillus heteromorphus CBS 117.55]PWY65570.1 hypothetical protein BO70DRAFT_302200 [Aspergillus heteromorphus CBS 117.55]
MSASVSASASSNLPSDSRSGPLRRLSQLRAYTQLHFSAQPSSSSSSSNAPRVSRRHTLGNRVSWFSPASTGTESAHLTPVGTTNSGPCPETEQPSTFARYSSVFFPSYRGLDIDLRSSLPHPESASSSPSNDTMSRPRGSSQALDVRPDLEGSSPSGSGNLHAGALESADPVMSENPSTSSPRPKQKATIRFFSHQDSHQSSRPSLPFIPVSRTLPSESCVIRVGRYSERDGLPVANPTEPSDAPVGFKSKVVSRKHCEFLYLNGQWHVKDVGSSSGTFLNHMRLSQPNMPSRLYSVKDGDIVQLGIDFRGGEEMIFRCVRIRIECNRSWQQQPNEFNKNTESLIKNLGKGETADYSGCRECSICLGSVLVPNVLKRPYQCLFMAACAHVWHYKCVSRLIHTPDYPMFQCPNCRAYTDLSAEVDDTNDIEEEAKQAASAEKQGSSEASRSGTPSHQPEAEPAREAVQSSFDDHRSGSLPVEAGLAANIENMHLHDTDASDAEPAPAPTSNPEATLSNGSEVPGWQSLTQTPSTIQTRQPHLRADTPVRSESSDDNPLTPLNDSGPLALDGRAAVP